METTKAVLFDMDGTIVNTAPLFERCYIEVLRSFGANADSESFRFHYSQGKTDTQFLEAYGLDPAKGAELFNVSLSMYLEVLRTDATWYEDALEVMDYFGKRMPIGIVTNATRANIEALDAKLDICSRFNVFIDRNDTDGIMKPDPRPLLLAAEKLGLPAQACAYVGDQTSDMLAAQASAMPGYLIQRDHTPLSALPHADKIIKDLRELLSCIK